MAVSEQSDSRSPVRPQLHFCSSPAAPALLWQGLRTWPSSPPKPNLAFTTLPSTMTPPPRPVPITAEIEVSRLCAPKMVKCPHSAPALPSLTYVTGRRSRASSFWRISYPAQSAWTKLVEPRMLRSEEHTSELQSHSFISYAVFC